MREKQRRRRQQQYEQEESRAGLKILLHFALSLSLSLSLSRRFEDLMMHFYDPAVQRRRRHFRSRQQIPRKRAVCKLKRAFFYTPDRRTRTPPPTCSHNAERAQHTMSFLVFCSVPSSSSSSFHLK